MIVICSFLLTMIFYTVTDVWRCNKEWNGETHGMPWYSFQYLLILLMKAREEQRVAAFLDGGSDADAHSLVGRGIGVQRVALPSRIVRVCRWERGGSSTTDRNARRASVCVRTRSEHACSAHPARPNSRMCDSRDRVDVVDGRDLLALFGRILLQHHRPVPQRHIQGKREGKRALALAAHGAHAT